MKMTQKPIDEKKPDGLNINAHVFVPTFAPQQPQPINTAANYASSHGYGYSGSNNTNNGHGTNNNYNNYQQQQQGEWEDYECDPEAYEGEQYGYMDEHGNFVTMDPHGGDHFDDQQENENGGMDSDEEAWMMEQIMKGEDEYDRVHGIVRDDKGAIVSMGVDLDGGDAAGGSISNNANKKQKLSNEATAQQFAKRCVEDDDDEDGEEPEPEFES